MVVVGEEREEGKPVAQLIWEMSCDRKNSIGDRYHGLFP